MKAVVFYDVGDIRLENVHGPKIKDPNDAIVRITPSAICGTNLNFICGTFTGVKKGRILGHEAVGVVEEIGKSVRNFRPGDHVIIPSTLGCERPGRSRSSAFIPRRSNPFLSARP